MSAIIANTSASVPTNDSFQTTGKQSTAKNRTAQITELFDALPSVEGFPLTTEQLWEYFNKACSNKDIKLRKLTVKKDDKPPTDKGPKRLTGYNIFTRDFKDTIPDGVKIMTHKAQLWKNLSKEEQAPYNLKALKENEANGITPKIKTPTFEERCAIWETNWKQWFSSDPATRGPEPEMPKKISKKTSTHTENSSSENSDHDA